MRFTGYILVVTVLISGCSTISDVKRYTPAIEYRHEITQNFRLGTPKTVNVGKPIIERDTRTYTQVTEYQFRARYSVTAGAFSINAGAVYPVILMDRHGHGMYVKGNADQSGVFGVKIDPSGELLNSHMFYYDFGGWQSNMLTHVGKVGTQLFEPMPSTHHYAPEYYQSELLYHSKVGDKVNLVFHQYKNKSATPIASQNLVYNLAQSDIIHFQNFEIRILNSNRQSIRYIVTRQ